MDIRLHKYLLDIQESIVHIEAFTVGVHSFFDYQGNLLLRRAIERELEIIGEALNRVLKIDMNISIENARRIVDLRNRIIHGYDNVDNAVIWAILKRHIPRLKMDVNRLIGTINFDDYL